MSDSSKRYTLGEEIFNSISHGTGSLLAIAGTVVLIVFSALTSDEWAVVSAALYGFSLIVLYTMSTLYHAITHEKAKRFFRIMDHNTIFLLIAGTYTPFTLVTLRTHGALGWAIFGAVWGAAVVGIVFTSIDLEKFKKPSLILYVVMGWAIISAIKPLSEELEGNITSLVFLLVGGAFYTLGVVFYAIKKVRYFHSVWHLFTVGGSIFHYFSIFLAITKIS